MKKTAMEKEVIKREKMKKKMAMKRAAEIGDENMYTIEEFDQKAEKKR